MVSKVVLSYESMATVHTRTCPIPLVLSLEPEAQWVRVRRSTILATSIWLATTVLKQLQPVVIAGRRLFFAAIHLASFNARGLVYMILTMAQLERGL